MRDCARRAQHRACVVGCVVRGAGVGDGRGAAGGFTRRRRQWVNFVGAAQSRACSGRAHAMLRIHVVVVV
ncbi:hypothetical protein EON62_04850, partial [archaeon]